MREIIGNTTATPNPRPDWEQTDSTKADYIKNKPTILTEEDVVGLIAENGSGGSVDVQINGISIVENGVANIPYANSEQAGVVSINPEYGIQCDATDNGNLKISFARVTDIDAKTSNRKPIVPEYLDYAVKTSVTTNTIELTDGEKDAVQEWLGAIKKPEYKQSGAISSATYPYTTVPVVLPDGTVSSDVATYWNIDSGLVRRTNRGTVITNNPVYNDDATNKKYVDDAISNIEIVAGGGTNVKINGTSITENGVANIPIASSTEAGVMKVSGTNYGIYVNSSGALSLTPADNNQVIARQSQFAPLTPYRINTIVKVGITDNKETLTDGEKESAQEWLGVTEKLAGKLDMPTGTTSLHRAIVIKPDGTQSTFQIADGGPRAYVIPYYGAAGSVGVDRVYENTGYISTCEPIAKSHAATKNYVDNAIAAIKVSGGTQKSLDALLADQNNKIQVDTETWCGSLDFANGILELCDKSVIISEFTPQGIVYNKGIANETTLLFPSDAETQITETFATREWVQKNASGGGTQLYDHKILLASADNTATSLKIYKTSSFDSGYTDLSQFNIDKPHYGHLWLYDDQAYEIYNGIVLITKKDNATFSCTIFENSYEKFVFGEAVTFVSEGTVWDEVTAV